MARPLGRGVVSFGLVSIPVEIYSAIEDHSIRFHMLHKKCGTRIQNQLLCPVCKVVVERTDLVRGFQVSKDQYVQVTDEELDALKAEGDNSIALEQFIPLEKVDPLYFESSYYLAPDKGAAKPYQLLADTMKKTGRQVGYQPGYAQQQAKSRRWRGSRLLRKPDLQEQVLNGLRQGWSPAQVAGRLKREQRGAVISYESIYRFIDSQIRRTQDYSWRHYLPRGKSQRGWRGHKGGSPVDPIQDRVPIDRRAAYIHKRRQAGHWEGDLMLFAKYGQAVLVTHERRSRLLVVSRQPNKAADPVATKLIELFSSLPQALRRTITFDNGTEFAYHYRLHKLSMRTFFCDPHAPWQKGGIENAIGRMRRALPRKTDLATLSNHRLLGLVRAYNHTPRKCLNYKTPAEVFCRDLLHLKCESTDKDPLRVVRE